MGENEKKKECEHRHYGKDLVDGTRMSSINPDRALSMINTSGVRGVSYNSSLKKWQASIGFQGKRITLGRFNTKEEAVKARKDAEEKYYKPCWEKNYQPKKPPKYLPYSKVIDLTGKEYQHFKVVRFAGRYRTTIKWLCQCECGKEFLATSTEITQKKVISCGCITSERKQYTYHAVKHGRKHYVDGTDVSKFLTDDPYPNNKTSGVKGVFQTTRAHEWFAKLTFKGVTYRVLCHSKEEAIRARKAMEEKYVNPFLEKHRKFIRKLKKNKQKKN